MNANNIIFSLASSEKIVIELTEPLAVVHCCYQAPMSLYLEGKQYQFPNESIRYTIQCFIPLLEKALSNTLYIDNSIKGLGYTENEYFQNKPGIVYREGKERAYWVGEDNHLWSGQGTTVWLYNASDGSIILELTPVYSNPINDPDDPKHYIPYEKWIKEYKPYVRKIIPQKIAQAWLDKARDILNTIEENMAKERKMFVNAEEKEIYNEWCTILKNEYGITDPRGSEADKIPEEFQTDEWWKKRGL
jgi:hypothetical protein